MNIRRYALFTDLTRGDFLLLIRPSGFATAHRWGGFIRWVGPVRIDPIRAGKKGGFTNYEHTQG